MMRINSCKWMALVVVTAMTGIALAQGPGPGSGPGNGPGRGGEGYGREMGGPAHRSLTPEQQEQVLMVLRDVNPQFAQRLEAGMRDNPEMAERVIRRLGPRMMHLAELRQHDPELYDLRVADQRHIFQTIKLSRELRQARDAGDEETVQRLKEEIRSGLEEHFGIRLALRERELAQLENRIGQLRDELQEHRQHKDELIQQQIQRIEAGQLWLPPPPEEGAMQPEGAAMPPLEGETPAQPESEASPPQQ